MVPSCPSRIQRVLERGCLKSSRKGGVISDELEGAVVQVDLETRRIRAGRKHVITQPTKRICA